MLVLQYFYKFQQHEPKKMKYEKIMVRGGGVGE